MSGRTGCRLARNHLPGIACWLCESPLMPEADRLLGVRQRSLEVQIAPAADGNHYTMEGQAFADRLFLLHLIDERKRS